MFLHELNQRLGKGLRLERIDRLTVHVEWKTRVGDAGDRQGGSFAQDTNGLTHMFRAGGTVEADDVDAHPFKDGQCGGDVGAKQHATRGIEGDLGLQRHIDLCLVEGLMNTRDGGPDFEDILRGFDQQQIHAALDEANSLLSKNFGQLVESDIRKVGVVGGGQLARGADRTRHEARLFCFCSKFICETARKGRGSLIDLDHTFAQFIFRHGDAVGAEGIGLEHVHTDLEERAMDLFHGFGVRDDEEVIAAVILLTAEFLRREVLVLQAGAHGAVEDENLLFEGIEVAAVGVFTI